jgi:microcystin-dependent protein
MTSTPYSYRTLQGGAAGLSVPVPFPFISRSHVQVFANLSLSEGTFDQLYISGTDYNWINDGQISMVASTTGKTLTVIRGTPIDAPLTTWTDGSNIDASDLLISDLQNLYVNQENRDKVNVSVDISLTTGDQLDGQTATTAEQNAALLAQVNAANATTLAQVNASNAATLAQVNAANAALSVQVTSLATDLTDVRSIALGAARVGMIAYTTSPTAPLGWGPAIGAIVSRTAFSELFAEIGTYFGAGDGLTTFKAGPDLRGLTLRGHDDGRGFDPGRVRGSLQLDQNKADIITFPYRRVTPASGSGVVASDLENTPSSGSTDTYALNLPGGAETRVRNVALMPIMKYHSRAIQVDVTATALVLYSNNFDTAPAVATGVNATLTPGLIQPSIALSPWWTGNYYANQTTSPSVLSLTGNVPAGVVKINFTLGFLGSWDSSNGEAQPDYLQILINNSPILTQLTTNNGSGSVQNYGGGTVVSRTPRTQNYLSSFDTLVDMSTAPSLTFIHPGGPLSFAIQGYGGGYEPTTTWGENPTIWDEGWGIDNLVVTVS